MAAVVVPDGKNVGDKIVEALGLERVTEAKIIVGLDQLVSAQVTIILTQDQVNKILGEG